MNRISIKIILILITAFPTIKDMGKNEYKTITIYLSIILSLKLSENCINCSNNYKLNYNI